MAINVDETLTKLHASETKFCTVLDTSDNLEKTLPVGAVITRILQDKEKSNFILRNADAPKPVKTKGNAHVPATRTRVTERPESVAPKTTVTASSPAPEQKK